MPDAEAKGVVESAVLVFQFSEAMDGPSIELAYTSTELPLEAVSFIWNDAGDTLTVVPKTKLAYAEGDQEVSAVGYSARITTDATDRDGVALAEDAVLTFTTLRRITIEPPLITSLRAAFAERAECRRRCRSVTRAGTPAVAGSSLSRWSACRAREDRSELRLQYPKITADGGGNYVQLSAANSTLELRYLAE